MAYIQRRRTKGWRMPPNTISCARPGKWSNPYRVGTPMEDGHAMTAKEAVEQYRAMLPHRSDLDVSELRGHDLACWCGVGDPCHVQDVLIPLASE